MQNFVGLFLIFFEILVVFAVPQPETDWTAVLDG